MTPALKEATEQEQTFSAVQDLVRFAHPEFGTLRVLASTNGEPLFVAADIARALSRWHAGALKKSIGEKPFLRILMKNGERFPMYSFLAMDGVEKAMQTTKQKTRAGEVRRWLSEEVLPNFGIFKEKVGPVPASAQQPLNLEKTTEVSEGFQIFESEEFGQVRVLTGEDGEPWFVAKDVAEVLGYTNPQKAVRDHCKKTQMIWVNDSFGRPQRTAIIPESDVYRLIMRSKMPQAENFQDWVTTDILPTIRRHGIYATDDVIEKTFTDPDSIIQIMERLKKEKAEKARIASERDEAVRTKAHISDKKTATAMSTASTYKRKFEVVSKENHRLKNRLGYGNQWRTVKGIPWLQKYFNTRDSGLYVSIGKQLTKICAQLGVEKDTQPHCDYGEIGVYPMIAIDTLEDKVKTDPGLLRQYRKRR